MHRLANRNVLIVGAPGSGKTTAEVKELVEEAERGDTAIICIDPHSESLAFSFFAHLCQLGHRDRVLYDRLTDVDRVLKWDFLSPSTAATPQERKGHDDKSCRQFADVLMRRRGKASLADTPNIEEWTLAALKLYLYQRRHRPLSDIRYAFAFDHPTFRSLFEDCTNEDVRYKFKSIIDSRQTPYKAAEKMIAGVCDSPAFEVRTSQLPGFNFDRHLDNRGILIVEGGEAGPLSPDAMQAMMGAVILKTINYVRTRRRRSPHVTLSMDEANNANLIGEAGHEVRALAECRKNLLGIHVLVQYLNFPSADITKGVMSTCDTRKYFYTSEPRTAAFLGEDLGGSFSSDGYKTRYYKDGTSFDAPVEFNNPYADELRNLEIGECYVRRHNVTSKEKIQPLPDPFGLSQATLAKVVDGLLRAVKQRPEYHAQQQCEELVATDHSAPPQGLPPSPDQPDEDDPLGI